jgi:apolipoprotein D and lipocalin family protein
MRKYLNVFILPTLCIVLFGCSQIPEGAVPIKPFDTKKYLGKWYEIARLDYRFERNMNNVTATYSLSNDGTIKVENSGYDFFDKEWRKAVGKAKLAGRPDEARLKVSFFGPFYAGYNIIAIDEDYTYAMVAGKNLDYLWILSRDTQIPEKIKTNYLKRAKEIGYNIDALIWVEHSKK